jgi:glycosyltransferase involved in cell wall biosynthesis
MWILVLTRYGYLGASSRVRFFQYLPYIQSSTVTVTVSPFFRDRYVEGLQMGHKSAVEALYAYTKRFSTLVTAQRFDLLWIEKEMFPWFPAWFEKIMLPAGIPYVLDYDDAVFHYYDLHSSRWVRRLLGEKHDRIMQAAVLVIAGNPYLADRANKAGASWVEIVPSVVDLNKYSVAATRHVGTNTEFVVGWAGSASTAMYLRLIEGPIWDLSKTDGMKFIAVGAGAFVADLPLVIKTWSEADEVAQIYGFDVGIMPLPDAPFERGKCGYKLIQYMACGKPVVASPVGVNTRIVEHGVNGFLAETPQEWEWALRTLHANPRLCDEMGAAGRKKVETEYSLQVMGPRVADLLLRAAKHGAH